MELMSSEPIARLREISTKLRSFDGPDSIARTDELEGVAEQIGSCAADLNDVEDRARVQYRLTVAVKSTQAARKAGRAHRRNPLTRPLSQARFALNMGKAAGGVRSALEILEGPDGDAAASVSPETPA